MTRLGLVLAVLVAVGILGSCGGEPGGDEVVVAPTAVGEPTAEAPAPPAEGDEPARHAYGSLPSQFGQLWMPDASGPHPVVVLVHGGFWLDRFGLDLMEPLASDLVARGYAVWNVEYRRLGADGGGWTATFDDVAAAVDALATIPQATELDLERVAFVGHSAGGHLAMWAAGRSTLAGDQRWAEPAVEPALVIGQAPVANLVAAALQGAGGGVVPAFLGGEPEEVPDRYRDATPPDDVSAELLIIHGELDEIVPAPWTTVGPRTAAARVSVADADHFDVIDPEHPAWLLTTDALDRSLR